MTSDIRFTRPVDFEIELEELAGAFTKTELAQVAGVGPKQLTPSRLSSLGHEPKQRLDTLWVMVSTVKRDLPSVQDISFFFRARHRELDLQTPLEVLAAGEAQRAVVWVLWLVGAPVDEASPAQTPSRARTIRRGGIASQPPRATARVQRQGLGDAAEDHRAALITSFVQRSRSGEALDFDQLAEVVERRAGE